MPNASNTDRVVAAIGGEDTTASRCIIAVQGPHARTRLAHRGPRRRRRAPLPGGPRFAWEGVACVAAGTGYTGEDGVEVAVPGRRRRRPCGRRSLAPASCPAGLGARDTLRLEAALPLHGHELGPGITPLQAGLGWVVGWDKGEFRGRGGPRAPSADGGVARHLVGLATEGRQPPRQGGAVVEDGAHRRAR